MSFPTIPAGNKVVRLSLAEFEAWKDRFRVERPVRTKRSRTPAAQEQVNQPEERP